MMYTKKIRCVLASKRNRSTEKGENDHTGVMDEANDRELNHTPAALDVYAYIEGKEKNTYQEA